MTTLEKLETLPAEIITDYLDRGTSTALDVETQHFVTQLQWAAEIHHHYPSVTHAAKKLAQRVKAIQGIAMTVRLAKERISDAINFFHVDLPIAQKVWDTKTADKLDSIVQLMLKSDKLEAAARYTIQANDLRKRANEAIGSEDIKAPIFLISNKISLTDMGFEKENLKSIAQKDNQGYYLKLINSLDIEPDDKKRLLFDAEIEDTDFEEIENDGQ